MSDELKAKLREIWSDVSDPDEGIAQIDQAYKDAGYVRGINLPMKDMRDKYDQLMTSQEWYERFEKMVLSSSVVRIDGVPVPVKLTKRGYLAIAKHAAGLE